jgi:predicted 3-demethylubiquinone-9 3-methyltransferase (glyoxalase superfamily)
MQDEQSGKRITTFLTFESKGKEAVDFYVSVFKNSHINSSMVMPGSDQLLHASFTLDGQDFMAMDGGDHFKFEDGFSLFITCQDQEEVDYYWEKLTADGGAPGQCGWLKDKYGVSWQVVPTALGELMSNPDQAAAGRVMQAMLGMGKIKVAELEAAANNTEV